MTRSRRGLRLNVAWREGESGVGREGEVVVGPRVRKGEQPRQRRNCGVEFFFSCSTSFSPCAFALRALPAVQFSCSRIKKDASREQIESSALRLEQEARGGRGRKEERLGGSSHATRLSSAIERKSRKGDESRSCIPHHAVIIKVSRGFGAEQGAPALHSEGENKEGGEQRKSETFAFFFFKKVSEKQKKSAEKSEKKKREIEGETKKTLANSFPPSVRR